MSLETPWNLLQRLRAEGFCFEAALPGLKEHGLSGEDIGALFGDPTSEMGQWLLAGAGNEPVTLNAVDPPASAELPERRTAKRGVLGWLSGTKAAEGLGLFTEGEIFELNLLQFSVLPEPMRAAVFGDVLPVRLLALNCTAEAATLTVDLDASTGVIQSPRRYALVLEPGAVTLAELPARVCPTTAGVVAVQALFSAEDSRATRRLKFSARPYARPDAAMRNLLVGASFTVATGLSPRLVRSGPTNQGTPDPLRVRVDVTSPLVAPQQEPAFWRLAAL